MNLHEVRRRHALALFGVTMVGGLTRPDVDYLGVMIASDGSLWISLAALVMLIPMLASQMFVWIGDAADQNFARRADASVSLADVYDVGSSNRILLLVILIPTVYSTPALVERFLG